MKARIKKLKHSGMEAYLFSCPGCEMEHMIPVSYTPEYAKKVQEARFRDAMPDWKPVVWTFNGSLELPTFQPSLLNTWEHGEGRTPKRCHLFVEAGHLNFCGDSTHRFAGRTVRMGDVD